MKILVFFHNKAYILQTRKMMQRVYSNSLQPSDTDNFNNILNNLDPAAFKKKKHALLMFTAVICHLQFLSFSIIGCLLI